MAEFRRGVEYSMKGILIKIPEWMDEEIVKISVNRLVRLEEKRRELIETTVKKLDLDEGDLAELERIRDELWKKEKERLKL